MISSIAIFSHIQLPIDVIVRVWYTLHYFNEALIMVNLGLLVHDLRVE